MSYKFTRQLIDLNDVTHVIFEYSEQHDDPMVGRMWKDSKNAGSVLRSIDGLPKITHLEGRWIVHGEPPTHVVECSVCGQKYFNHAMQPLANYCSNCGAKMDEEEQENG